MFVDAEISPCEHRAVCVLVLAPVDQPSSMDEVPVEPRC